MQYDLSGGGFIHSSPPFFSRKCSFLSPLSLQFLHSLVLFVQYSSSFSYIYKLTLVFFGSSNTLSSSPLLSSFSSIKTHSFRIDINWCVCPLLLFFLSLSLHFLLLLLSLFRFFFLYIFFLLLRHRMLFPPSFLSLGMKTPNNTDPGPDGSVCVIPPQVSALLTGLFHACRAVPFIPK